jgi:hypothetical protein
MTDRHLGLGSRHCGCHPYKTHEQAYAHKPKNVLQNYVRGNGGIRISLE